MKSLSGYLVVEPGERPDVASFGETIGTAIMNHVGRRNAVGFAQSMLIWKGMMKQGYRLQPVTIVPVEGVRP